MEKINRYLSKRKNFLTRNSEALALGIVQEERKNDEKMYTLWIRNERRLCD